jgi:hypothetical protein
MDPATPVYLFSGDRIRSGTAARGKEGLRVFPHGRCSD